MQCKDIPDTPILAFLDSLNGRLATWFDCDPRQDNTVIRAMPPRTPKKLVLAKMRMMIRRGLVDGCPCGCRGDYALTEKGKALLVAEQNINTMP
jgi:hypothetical protein